MKKILSYLIPALILVGIVGVIAFKLKQNKDLSQERVYHYDPAEATAALPPNPGGKTGESSPPPEAEKLVFTGVFEPARETKISAELQGKINQVTVDAGSIVSKGQTLVRLDDALLRLQLESVDVQIEGLTADVNRYAILAKADAVQGIQLEKAELGLKSAKVQRATIIEQINKTTIKAPFNGVVFAKMNEIGGFAAPGVPLLHIGDISTLQFTINVPEGDLCHFILGQSYDVIADVFPDKVLQGKVSMIASKANPGNSFSIQFTVDNFSKDALRAGMFGKVELSTKR